MDLSEMNNDNKVHIKLQMLNVGIPSSFTTRHCNQMELGGAGSPCVQES